MVTNGSMVFLLGRRDEPTDGVEDYCVYLGRALETRGFAANLVRVPWARLGWGRGLLWVFRQSRHWRRTWVLVQYTALAWSRRGMPLAFPWVIFVLRLRGCRCAVVFHDPNGFPGTRLRDRVRRSTQLVAMKVASLLAHRSIVTVPLDRLSWRPPRAAFVPVGANLRPDGERRGGGDGILTVAVYGVTAGHRAEKEAEDIAFAVERAAACLAREGKQMRLRVFGRGAIEADALLRGRLRHVELDVRGVLPAAEVAELLATSSVHLFVRGSISSRRGTGLAGIASGLPVVGFRGPETAPPVTEAGVLLVRDGDRGALADALAQVLQHDNLRYELAARSRKAYEQYFSWDAITERVLSALEVGTHG